MIKIKKMLRHSVIVLYGEQIEAFRDMRHFVKAKGLNYSTWIKKRFPALYKGASLEKIKGVEIFESVRIMGENIKLQ